MVRGSATTANASNTSTHLLYSNCTFPARHGLSVEAACTSVSKDLLDVFNFALVWGRSTKFNPQRVGLSHVLMDEDVFQVVPKTLVQQKQSKDYRQKVRQHKSLAHHVSDHSSQIHKKFTHFVSMFFLF